MTSTQNVLNTAFFKVIIGSLKNGPNTLPKIFSWCCYGYRRVLLVWPDDLVAPGFPRQGTLGLTITTLLPLPEGRFLFASCYGRHSANLPRRPFRGPGLGFQRVVCFPRCLATRPRLPLLNRIVRNSDVFYFIFSFGPVVSYQVASVSLSQCPMDPSTYWYYRSFLPSYTSWFAIPSRARYLSKYKAKAAISIPIQVIISGFSFLSGY